MRRIRKYPMAKLFSCGMAVLTAAVLFLPVQIKAAEKFCTVNIPVSVLVTGDNPVLQDNIIYIKSENGAPLPQEQEVAVTDQSDSQLGPITFTVPGDYVYQVGQKKGNHADVRYDETEYTVTVRVTNADDHSLEAQIWAIRGNGSQKTDQICFTNHYTAPAAARVVPAVIKNSAKTGDLRHPALWMAFFSGSCGVYIAAISGQKKRRMKERMAG